MGVVPVRPDERSEEIARLLAVSEAFGRAFTVDEVAEAVFREAMAAVGAVAGFVALVHEQARRLEVVARTGVDPRDIGAQEWIPLDEEVPSATVTRTGESVFLGERAEWEERFPALRGRAGGHQAMAALPLRTDRLLGAIVLRFDDAREFGERERQFLDAVARQAAQALQRAQLWEAERAARADAEDARARLAFLVRAGEELAQSLDVTAVLARTADLVVPGIADSCVVELVDDRGRLQPARVAHRDPVREALVRRILDRYPSADVPTYPGRVALETGAPVVLPHIDEPTWRSFAVDEEHYELMRRTQAGSGLVVPLQARGRRIGTLVLGRDEGSRPFTDADTETACGLGARVAVAIDTARIVADRSAVARSLQGSLLPPLLPDIPGLDVAARYYPAAGETELGGDFYDFFPLSGDNWGVVIGDVSGKGTEAAALTALARFAVRGAAMREPSPSRVLEVVNRAILAGPHGERFATLCYLVCEPVREGVRVRLCAGGHPLPFLLTSYGEVDEVGRPGSAIGMFPDVELAEEERMLHPGDALLLFTDGLIEARTPEGSFAPDLVPAVLRLSTGLSAEEVATAVEKAVLELEAGLHRDDLAFLVLRVPHSRDVPTQRLDLPVDRSRSGVPAARHAVAEWLTGCGVPRATVEDVGLVVSELVTNSVRASRGEVAVRVWVEPGGVVLEVYDDGPGFDAGLAERDAPPDPSLEMGRGLFIVHTLVDDLSTRFDARGTTVRARVPC